MANVKTLIDLIGNTPIVQVKNMDTGPCNLFLKMEGMNPGSSIKDRVALNIIETAEREGKLKPGYTIIEASAGNTAMGLALIRAGRGASRRWGPLWWPKLWLAVTQTLDTHPGVDMK